MISPLELRHTADVRTQSKSNYLNSHFFPRQIYMVPATNYKPLLAAGRYKRLATPTVACLHAEDRETKERLPWLYSVSAGI